MARSRLKPSGWRGSRAIRSAPEVFTKLNHEELRKLGVNKLPSLDYSWRRGAETRDIPSLDAHGSGACISRSVMDPVSLAKESPEVREAIIAKSRRLAPAYNKGAVQYVSDETDPKTIGRK